MPTSPLGPTTYGLPFLAIPTPFPHRRRPDDRRGSSCGDPRRRVGLCRPCKFPRGIRGPRSWRPRKCPENLGGNAVCSGWRSWSGRHHGPRPAARNRLFRRSDPPAARHLPPDPSPKKCKKRHHDHRPMAGFSQLDPRSHTEPQNPRDARLVQASETFMKFRSGPRRSVPIGQCLPWTKRGRPRWADHR